MGYNFLWKVYERVPFSIKNGIEKGKGLDHGGVASPYKTLLSANWPGLARIVVAPCSFTVFIRLNATLE